MTARSRRLGLSVVFTVGFLGAADVLGFLAGAEHHGGPWNQVPLGDLLLGGVGAFGLVWLARRVLKRVLTRPEGYYDGGAGP